MGEAVPKLCRICGQDCSRRDRVRNAQGQYACSECFREEREAARNKRAASPREQDPDATPVDGERVGDPALAETVVDQELDADAVPAPPNSSMFDIALPTRSRGNWPGTVPDLDQLPPDRSGSIRRSRVGEFAFATCFGVLVVACVHGGVAPVPERYSQAAAGALSALLQIVCGEVIFALGTLIWIDRARSWSYCLLAIASEFVWIAAAALALWKLPYIGWLLPIGLYLLMARRSLALEWDQALYFAAAAFATTASVRIALLPSGF